MPGAQAEGWRGGDLGRFVSDREAPASHLKSAAQEARGPEILRRAHLYRAVDCFRHVA